MKLFLLVIEESSYKFFRMDNTFNVSNGTPCSDEVLTFSSFDMVLASFLHVDVPTILQMETGQIVELPNA